MHGERMPEHLGPGEWVVYAYHTEPATLYCVGPYTTYEADMVAVLLRTPAYKAQGFDWIQRVTV